MKYEYESAEFDRWVYHDIQYGAISEPECVCVKRIKVYV